MMIILNRIIGVVTLQVKLRVQSCWYNTYHSYADVVIIVTFMIALSRSDEC